MTPNRNLIAAFLLSFIPGLGHLYLHRFFRALCYGGGFFGPLLLFFMIMVSGYNGEEALLLLVFAAFVWFINMLDMVITLIKPHPVPYPPDPFQPHAPYPYPADYAAQEKLRTALLSVVPGLGHYRLGLMQRGLTAMIAFFGSAVLIIFVAVVANKGAFLTFLLVLPIIWFYTMFDALKQVERKLAGLELYDHSLFEEFQSGGRKNKTLATIIAVFPGAAHLYLSLPKRGLQLMALFLFSIYVLDLLRLSVFFFLIPIIWFFSLFDALQSISRYENGTLVDQPILEAWVPYYKGVGFMMILLGAYYLFRTGMRELTHFYPNWQFAFWLTDYVQTAIITFILIGSGIYLMRVQKNKKRSTPAPFDHDHS